MPLPSIDETTEGSLLTEVVPSLEFTYVESLMFAFHQLARQNKEFLSENAERCKDFRARYFQQSITFKSDKIIIILNQTEQLLNLEVLDGKHLFC